MKRILQLDGGGCKGIMQLVWLNHIENKVGKPIYEIFDLIVGTSIGAIVGAIAASGKINMDDALYRMLYELPRIFKKRFRIPIIQPKYKRKVADKLISEIIGSDTLMRFLLTDLMITSVNMVDGRNHFFKSWEREDGKLNVVDAVNRSYAAPLFFGGIVDRKNESVWLDGGTGNMNCPIDYAVQQVLRNNWFGIDDGALILSLGTGHHDSSIPFHKAARSKNAKQVAFFMDPKGGGLARKQAFSSKISLCDVISTTLPEYLKIKRVDVEIPEKIDVLDGTDHIYDYILYAERVTRDIPINDLK